MMARRSTLLSRGGGVGRSSSGTEVKPGVPFSVDSLVALRTSVGPVILLWTVVGVLLPLDEGFLPFGFGGSLKKLDSERFGLKMGDVMDRTEPIMDRRKDTSK
jgi:hypothetical protein